MKILRTDFKRMFCSTGFWVALCGTVIAGLIGSYDFSISAASGQGVIPGEVFVNAALSGCSSPIFLLLLPILCALPYTHAFTEDTNSGFIVSYLPRAGRKAYLGSRAAVTALGGGIALAAGLLLLIAIYTAMYPPTGVTAEELGISPEIMVDLPYYMERLLLVFLSACIWSLVGGISAAATMNRYMGYACPFIIYYVLSSFQGRYFGGIYILNPQEWVFPGHISYGTALLCSAVVLFAVFFVDYSLMKRRLRHV